MTKYIIPLLRRKQSDLCARCDEPLFDFQINHKRYAENITLNDLELLHGECHAAFHGVRGVQGTTRKISYDTTD